jgi:hypothetical protein
MNLSAQRQNPDPKSMTPPEMAWAIKSLLERHATVILPEHKLWLEVLCNTITELMPGQRNNPADRRYTSMVKRSAAEYFTSRRHVLLCDCLGLDPDWVLEILRDYAGLEVS